jgi:glyoxylase-like metal-dependent hydrolase (beta-lactamase superfamily II)
MKFGTFEVTTVTFGTFRLDGGAMFGSVPKNLWSKRIAADEENCIPLAARCLLITAADRKILVDVGLGDKWEKKQIDIFQIRNAPLNTLPFAPSDITDIVLTHLHFDHAGGISRWRSPDVKEPELVYPQARIFLQRANWENAQSPSLRERASYLPENVTVLKSANLSLLDGSTEILPGLWVHRVDGHTIGQQWIELRDGKRSIMYPTDLIPTSHHVPLPFTMGYDICAAAVMKEKEDFLRQAIDRNALVVYEHDPLVAASSVALDERGHFVAKDPLTAV